MVRNHFGEVLEGLKKSGEPILIEKRKKIEAVLISYEDFNDRFIDKQADEKKMKFMEQILSHAEPSLIEEDPVFTLRKLRGYPD